MVPSVLLTPPKYSPLGPFMEDDSKIESKIDSNVDSKPETIDRESKEGEGDLSIQPSIVQTSIGGAEKGEEKRTRRVVTQVPQAPLSKGSIKLHTDLPVALESAVMKVGVRVRLRLRIRVSVYLKDN
jgi:hypothetical protein